MGYVRIYSFIITLILTQAFNVYAQPVNDARLWLSGSIEKKFTEKTSLEYSACIRLNENYSELGAYYHDIGLNYRWTKNFRPELHYRYSGQRRMNDTYRQRHRFYVDLNYRIKTGTPFVFHLRGRYQVQYSDYYTNESGRNAARNLRGRLKINYDLKRPLKPYIFSELFYLLDNSEQYFSRVRYAAGVEYEMNKRNEVDLFYLIQMELNAEYPTHAYIIGLAYKFIW